jgi:uncharacterized membrane protein
MLFNLISYYNKLYIDLYAGLDAAHQLIEVALRALSLGINEPYSAIAFVDKLTAMICNLTQENFPQGTTYNDEDDIERISYKTTSFQNIAYD